MNPIDVFLSEPFAQPMGWTLLHFVWQGGLVALLLAVALRTLHRHSAQVRYAVACGALLLLVALPIITLSLLWPTTPEGTAFVAAPKMAATPTMEATPEAAAAVPSEGPVSWQQAAYITLGAALPWLVLIWILGVLTLSMRYLVGWTYTLHLRRRGTREVGWRWQEQRARLARLLGVTRPVRLVASALVHVPTVAGWLRPVILMPVGVFTGLTPRQVEMIIAHELAHIRRHDYLVNLLQAFCETVLFYHPAVWWISQRIRVEREHCCDDLVVAVCGDAFTYAEALTKMEEGRQAAPRLALAATGGSLMDRVRRLLEGPAEATPGAARWFAGLTLVAVLLISLTLAPVLDDAWDQAYAWITGNQTEETLHASWNDDHRRLHPLGRGGYDDTALRLKRLVFDDPSTSVQMEALDELRRLPKRTSLTSLINIAERHPRSQVRNEAVQWLGRIGDAYVVYTLERIALDDHSFSVQMEALDALRNLPRKIGLPSLMKLAQVHPRAAMRSEAVQWISRIDGETGRMLLERILFEDADASVQEEAFDALEKLINNPWTFNQIAETHPTEAVREKAYQWLRRWRFEQDRLQGKQRRQRDYVSRFQAAAREYQSTAVKLERLVFEDEDPSVQQEALEALMNLPGGAIKPSLERIIATHPDATLREKATARLRAVHTKEALNKQMVAALETSHNNPRASERAEAVKMLKDWTSPSVFRLLSSIAFDDPSVEVQMTALSALRERGGLEGMAQIAYIVRNHTNPMMRLQAVQSIDDMQADDRLPLLEEITFNDEDPTVQEEALMQLSSAPEVEMTIPALQRVAEEHPSLLFRATARQRLGVIQKTDDEDDDTYTWSQALDDLRHPSASRRLKALDKVEEKKGIDLIPTLADMAYEDPSLEVQLEILDIFRDRGDWDGDSWVVHIAQNHPDPEMRNEAVQSLDSQDPTVIQPVLQHIALQDESPEVQREALDRLADLPAAYGVPALLKIAQIHRDAAMRREALEELLDYRNHPAAQKALQKLKDQ